MDSFDVIVIGGGPAGMMAAARAARCGAKVLLLDKNKELGRKLMLTGRGRCNFAHDEPDTERLAEAYGDGAAFIKPALEAFDLEKTLNFFSLRGVKVAHERGKRIYPADDQDAKTLLQALRRELRERSVLILGATEVRSLDIMGGKARRVMTHRGEINGRAFIVATGGMSFSMTGCSGDGYRWARKAGCAVVEPRPAICPIKVSEGFCADMGALKLKNVRLTLIYQGEEVATRFGEMDFAPFGISGATAMDLADTIGQCLDKGGSLSLLIDLKPALDPERLDARIERDFDAIGETPLRFALRKMLPKELIPVILRRCGLDEGLPCGQTPQEKRETLRNAIKNFTVTPVGLMGFRFAIVTAGGVNRDDVDENTLASRKVPNLFFAGEVLDIDGPTGGYNLQACWSTGVLAGQSAALQLGFEVPAKDDVLQTPPPFPERSATEERPRPERTATSRRSDETRTYAKRGPHGDKPSFRKDRPSSERREDRPSFRKEGTPSESRDERAGRTSDRSSYRHGAKPQRPASQNRDGASSYKKDDSRAPRRDRPEEQGKTRGTSFAPNRRDDSRAPRRDRPEEQGKTRGTSFAPNRRDDSRAPRRDRPEEQGKTRGTSFAPNRRDDSKAPRRDRPEEQGKTRGTSFAPNRRDDSRAPRRDRPEEQNKTRGTSFAPNRRDDSRAPRRDKPEEQNKTRGASFAPNRRDDSRAPRRDKPEEQNKTRGKTFTPQAGAAGSRTPKSKDARPDKPMAPRRNETSKKPDNIKKNSRSTRNTTADFAGWKGLSKKKVTSTPRPSKKEE